MLVLLHYLNEILLPLAILKLLVTLHKNICRFTFYSEVLSKTKASKVVVESNTSSVVLDVLYK